MTALVLYGAGGFTGKLVLEAVRKELPVVAAARRPPADESGDTVRIALEDSARLRELLSDAPAVLNCAGPFARTWQPIVAACLDTGTHYLDLCAEWRVFEALQELDGLARERGVMLLPGVGFDVLASDCLASHVAARVPHGQRLEIGISGLELVSRGSARTLLDLAGEPVRVRRGGRIVSEPRIQQASFDFGQGPRAAYAVSWGDVSTAGRTTGIGDVAVYFEATPLVAGLALANRSFGWMARTPLLGRLARAQLEMLPPGPAPHRRVGRRAVLVARVVGDGGRTAESRLVTPEAYTFSARAAASVARHVLEGAVAPGFQTPASLLGADFVLGLEGVERTDRVGP